uniref:Uncharacterized protein n=1 Tax=Anopheles arabiensis TaxID=7173 RepID=A0A182IHL5_ANOAR
MKFLAFTHDADAEVRCACV